MQKKKMVVSRAVRESINRLSGGICFAMPDGVPVLTNRRMNLLIDQLTGHTILNALETWKELEQIQEAGGCVKRKNPISGDDSRLYGDSVIFEFPGGSIWQFRKENLCEKSPCYIQMQATDVSELYRSGKQLYENNKRLKQQYKRQQELLENIVQINREKELLSMKMKIHDELGRCILMTKKSLSESLEPETVKDLVGIWSNAIQKLTDMTVVREQQNSSPEVELNKVAGIIGCTIEYHGERPEERGTKLLFYAAVREALTNAVRHANADRLVVSTETNSEGYHVEISDNGKQDYSIVMEGDGLTNLRRRLEREGAKLQIKSEKGVVLYMDFPAERRKEECE